MASESVSAHSPDPDFAQNDQRFSQLLSNTEGFTKVCEIDHARLAYEAGVKTMPASRVLIFSHPEVSTALLSADRRLGLELPYRVLAYEQDSEACVAFTDATFLRARYGLPHSVSLDDYEGDLLKSVKGLDPKVLRRVTGEKVGEGYGIVTVRSDYGFESTITRLKSAILSQGDTVWFGTVAYHDEAEKLGKSLPKTSLLLFGGPGPGGKAMTDYPKLGLDAFCQKVLVLEEIDGSVTLRFNDIVALAKLHYGSNNKAQAVINGRLTATFTAAVSAGN